MPKPTLPSILLILSIIVLVFVFITPVVSTPHAHSTHIPPSSNHLQLSKRDPQTSLPPTSTSVLPVPSQTTITSQPQKGGGFFDDDGLSKIVVGAIVLLFLAIMVCICVWTWKTNGRNCNGQMCYVPCV
ncbi:uncharacterized protein VTP21DRAFT_4747 [Calcarisporiella thermophila]|uniref:uncharacterized protein n=1 Tax=Calcarisporiella thermophila TaxID=911321 RepID=UPI003743E2F3